MNLYKHLAKYHDLLFNTDYATQTKVCASILKKLDMPYGTLLDIGCGTGNHMLEFKKLGYTANGLDSSKYMIEEAKKKLPESVFYNTKMEWFNVNQKFDVITLLSRTILHAKNNFWLKIILKRILNHLKKSGIILIDLDIHEWHYDHLYNRTQYLRKSNILEGSLTESYDLRDNKVLWSTNLSIKDKGEYIRNVETVEYLLLNVHSLLKMMRQAGFSVHVYTQNGRETKNYEQSLLIAGLKR